MNDTPLSATGYQPDYLVTAGEVATRFGISYRTAQNMVSEVRVQYGILPRFRITVAQFNAVNGPRNYRFPIAETAP
jgi:hypothetical protein